MAGKSYGYYSATSNISLKQLFSYLKDSPELVTSTVPKNSRGLYEFKTIVERLRDNTTVALLDSQVQVGQAVRVKSDKYYVKIGNNEYIDMVDGSRYTAYELARMSNLNFSIVSKQEVYNKLDSIGLLNKGKKHIEMDIETSLKMDSKSPRIRDVYQIGWVEVEANSGKITSKFNVLNYDILKRGIKAARSVVKNDYSKLSNRRIQEQIVNKWKDSADMSRKLRETYLKYINMFVKDDKELIEHINGKSGYHIIQSDNTTTVIGGAKGIKKYMSEWAKVIAPQIDAGDVTISSFNPSGIDQSLLDVILDVYSRKGNPKIHLGDSRTYTLMLNSLIYGSSGYDFISENFWMVNNVLDKLGVAGTIRQDIIESMYNGPTSSFSPASSEESLINILRQAKEYGKTSRYIEAHESISDAVDAVNLLYSTRNYLKEITTNATPIKEANIQKRMAMAYMKELITNKILRSPAGQQFLDAADNYYEATNLFYKFFDKTTGLEKAKEFIDTQTMAYSGRKMIGNLFGDARFQFDLYKDVMLSDKAAANSVNSFLVAAFGAGFVKWAVAKAAARKREDMLSDTQGLNHNSLPTIIRRLQMTDFGSARSSGNWTTLSYYFIKATFDEVRSKGLGKSIGNLLSNINKLIKYRLTKGEFEDIDKIKRNIKDESKIVGNRLYDTIFKKDTPTKNNVKEAIKSVYEKSSNIYDKIKNVDFDKIHIKDLSESLVSKWKNIPIESRVYIASGVGIGMLGAMMLNSMRGDYDPYYDYHDYIDRDYSLPRNYRRNIRYVRSLRHIRDLSEIRYNDDESRQRFISRQQHSDFGSKIQTLIEGMWEKNIYKWGKLRPSLEKAFNMVKNKFRVFKNDANVIIQSPANNYNIDTAKLKKAVSKAANVAIASESKDMANGMLSIMDDYSSSITNRLPSFVKYKQISYKNGNINRILKDKMIKGALKNDIDKISVELASNESLNNISVNNKLSDYRMKLYKKIMDKTVIANRVNPKVKDDVFSYSKSLIINDADKMNVNNAMHSYTYIKAPHLVKQDRLVNYLRSDPMFIKEDNITSRISYKDAPTLKNTVSKLNNNDSKRVGKLYDKIPKGDRDLAAYEAAKENIDLNKSTYTIDNRLYSSQIDKKDATYKANKYVARLIAEKMLSTRFGRLHTSYGSFMPYEYKSNIDIDFLPGWH